MKARMAKRVAMKTAEDPLFKKLRIKAGMRIAVLHAPHEFEKRLGGLPPGVERATEVRGEFDLIHNHLDWLPLAFAAQFKAPLVTTIHGFSGRGILPAYVNARASSFVSISDADRSPELNYVATVHHGIDLEALPFSAAGGSDLVAFGRIHPDKGTHQAIAIAQQGSAGYCVTFDVDALDPRDAPGSGTLVRGGLSYRESHLAMEKIAEAGGMRSLEVVEINTALDVNNRTAELGVELILSALGKTIL